MFTPSLQFLTSRHQYKPRVTKRVREKTYHIPQYNVPRDRYMDLKDEYVGDRRVCPRSPRQFRSKMLDYSLNYSYSHPLCPIYDIRPRYYDRLEASHSSRLVPIIRHFSFARYHQFSNYTVLHFNPNL